MKGLLTVGVVCLFALSVRAADRDYPVKPIPFTDVSIKDRFWTPRLVTTRLVSIPYCFEKCEETGRIDNFAIAGGLMEGKYRGALYNDSDLYKVIEAAAYSLSVHPDPKLERYVDEVVAKIAAAQEPDGYLSTLRTIGLENVDPNNKPNLESYGAERWSRMDHGHELYCVGHMYEAAVAYHLATSKRTLLDVSVKNADLIAGVFGSDKKRDVSGHQEIEIGLVKLYRVTGDTKYLDLAKFFLDERGHYHGRSPHSFRGSITYAQDHKPVITQTEPAGHVVRALYMYSGMADMAAITGDKDYIKAIDTIWENIVSKRLYLTGNMGVQGYLEGFGEDYMLPNLKAYNETCAAVANAMWNHRMFLLHGDAKYVDVLERVLYNGVLSGVSLEGNRFFYRNPLASTGTGSGAVRQPWFGTACCPTNISRFLPSVPGYVYAHRDDIIYINLFVGGIGQIKTEKVTVQLTQETDYPWDGKVKIKVDPDRTEKFALYIRIPGWAQNQPVPSDLYRYIGKTEQAISLSVNGERVPLKLRKGYARISRRWRRGDVVELDLPMPVHRVLSHGRVTENKGRIALERGPVVFCAEGIDNNGSTLDLVIDDKTELAVKYRDDILGGIVTISGHALREKDDLRVNEQDFVAIPYYAWAHRGSNEMAVWLLRELPKATLREAESGLPGLVEGIRYEYFEGEWKSALPDFSELTPVISGTTGQFNLSYRKRDEYYALRFAGYVEVPGDGKYTFYVNSDDGSKLFISDEELANNDGHHGMVEVSSQITLKAGKHPIKVLYFQADGGYGFEVKYKGPGIPKQAIPAHVLFTGDIRN